MSPTDPRPVSPEAAPNLLTRVLIAEAEQWDAEHPSPLAEAAPPRATTEYCNQFADAEQRYVCRYEAGHYGPHHPHINRESSVHRAPLAAHPATTPEPDDDATPWLDKVGPVQFLDEVIEAIDAGKPPMVHRAEFVKLRASLVPSKEIGKLIDAAVSAAIKGHKSDPWQRRREDLCAAVAALEAHLSTLERDAARMREAATEILTAYDRGYVKSAHSNHAQRAFKLLRATLPPSPDTT